MLDLDRNFSVASDKTLVHLIEKARERLVLVAPAISDAVAKALEARLDEGSVSATVILDADPEVYRLGYGTETAFDRVRAASCRNQLDLRIQEGGRIGVIISDAISMLFSPVPLLIEAGSTSIKKPNAILLSGNTVERLAEATGAGAPENIDRQEIGTRPLTPDTVAALKNDLKSSPPQPFDVSRALRVFNSKVQYVEFQVENYRFSTRQVKLPPELLDIVDDDLKNQISSRLRVPVEFLSAFDMEIEHKNGKRTEKVDEKWICARPDTRAWPASAGPSPSQWPPTISSGCPS